jgi:Ni/Fe-hydrogenase subunit HybB-like protein
MHRHALGLLTRNRTETWLFLLEIALLAVPAALLFQRSVRMNPGALYAAAVMVIFGFICNRLNVGITALEASSGTNYVPRWSEIAITLAIVAAGFAIFRIVAEYFPVFEVQAREPAFSEARETAEARVEVG